MCADGAGGKEITIFAIQILLFSLLRCSIVEILNFIAVCGWTQFFPVSQRVFNDITGVFSGDYHFFRIVIE